MDLVNDADRVQVVYYTDPLCCWSWAFEEQWQRLIKEYSEFFDRTYCMGGLIPDWKTFSDPMNAISRPLQMGPLWYEIQQLTSCEVNDNIWIDDPPSSSYPACIAVKTAGLQSAAAAERYLYLIRKAVMAEGRNIARPEVLAEVAEQLSELYPDFDASLFKRQYNCQEARDAFRNDLNQVKIHKIGRFPTLIFNKSGRGLMITGFRPYDALEKVLLQLINPQPEKNYSEI
ncbi:DsbA family protein [Desertivirga xinjiangensis]|uniref:DsbA family protein n=1 Tax=Desertivirga xinjiangensis TaxID=539206 RepID=UPI00210B6E63